MKCTSTDIVGGIRQGCPRKSVKRVVLSIRHVRRARCHISSVGKGRRAGSAGGFSSFSAP